MKSSVLGRLYTQDKLECKVAEYVKRYEKSRSSKNYRSMASNCYDIARIFELLEEKEKSNYYYQKIVDDWNDHSDEIPYYICVNALKALKRPEEAFKIVLAYARSWDLKGLGAAHASMLSRFCSYWRPHYLQKAADLYQEAQDFEMVKIYNQRAIETWEKMKDNIEKPLVPIEEAWLFEEIGHIYEKAGKFDIAREYYDRAESKYELAYTEDPTATGAHQVDGDWDYYLGFFAKQIPDFRLISFRSDGLEENDYRRIKYRILSLQEQMKEQEQR